MQEKKKINSNIRIAIYSTTFIIIALIIVGSIWFLWNKNKLSDEELFIADSIIDYEKYLKKMEMLILI